MSGKSRFVEAIAVSQTFGSAFASRRAALKTPLLIALMAAVLVMPSHAGTRNFFTPTVGGDRLSFCADAGSPCGKPIADAWCRAIGFEQALNYQRDRSATGQPIVARYADTGGLCSGEDCESFRQIKCWIGAK